VHRKTQNYSPVLCTEHLPNWYQLADSPMIMIAQLKTLSINQGYCFIKKKGFYHKIYIEDILYMKADGDYAIIYTSNGQFYNSNSLNALELLFESNSFCRIHRSYLINIKKIISINIKESRITIGVHSIPISRTIKGDFLKKLILID